MPEFAHIRVGKASRQLLCRYTSADCDNGSNGCHQTSVLQAGALLETVRGSCRLRGS